jgi:probable F420-dependent oxidoreductase
VHVGVYFWALDQGMRIDEAARVVEGFGFESLFVGEHTHIPVRSESAYPYGGSTPDEYARFLDPFVALAVAAGVTQRLKIGTCICLITERDPIVTAKTIASLDFVSDGRVLFGVAPGWNAEEMAHHGTPFGARFRVMRERVLAMKEIWTTEEASFRGEFVRFDPIRSWPKPVHRPHPPVLIGGESAHARARVVEYGDGWFPRASRVGDEAVLGGVRDLARLAEKSGRDPAALTTSVYGVRPDRRTLERYRGAGVDRVVLALPMGDRSALMLALEEYAPLSADMERTA